jgi:hypothetical protein
MDLLYSSETGADELPFWLTSPLATNDVDKGLLLIPGSLDCSDVRFAVSGQGFGTGASYLQYLKDTFDGLYAEGQSDQAKMMTVTLHPRIVGHGSRMHYLEQCVSLPDETCSQKVMPGSSNTSRLGKTYG